MLAPWDSIIGVDLAQRSNVLETLDTELERRIQFGNESLNRGKWEMLENEVEKMKLASTSVYHFAKGLQTSEEKRAEHRAAKEKLEEEMKVISGDMRGMQKDIGILLNCKQRTEKRLKHNSEFKHYLQSVVNEDPKNFKSPIDVLKRAQSYLIIRENLLANISELEEAILDGKRRLAWIESWKMLVNSRVSNDMSQAWNREAEVMTRLARLESYFADASKKVKGQSTLSARIEACVVNIHRLLEDQLRITSNLKTKPVTLTTQLEEIPKLVAELRKMAVVMRSDYIGESDEGFQGPSTVSN